jgi:hypothetical protein
MGKITLLCILGALVAAAALAPATASTLLTPPGETRVVRPGDRWEPPATERQLEIMDRIRATERYAVLEDGTVWRIRGKAERRAYRQASWAASLEADRRIIHDAYGRPAYRYYEYRAGKVLEYWTYPEGRTTFVFRDQTLVARKIY